jgi:hypothetical protein
MTREEQGGLCAAFNAMVQHYAALDRIARLEADSARVEKLKAQLALLTGVQHD